MSGVSLGSERYLDWLSGTVPVPADSSPAAVAVMVGELCGGFVLLDRGGMGYTSAASVLGSGRVLWHPDRSEMGVHVVLPASALERLPGDWRGFVQALLWVGAKFTRCDLALDQHETALDVVRAAVAARQVVSRFRKALHMQNMWGEGETVYLGAPSSDTKVRIYDKRAESLERGEEVPEGVWVRCEVEFHRERADAVLRGVYDGEDPAGFVRAVLDFRDLTEDGRSNRCTVFDWWERWLGGVQKAIFNLPKRAGDLDSLRRWVRRQVAPTLALLLKADEDNPFWLLDSALAAWCRVPSWKRQYLGVGAPTH